ncbi:hypothetical protein niasHS_005133 [Heterodera schachtii]|uniref:Uncharacterized protein n=1 Tax=Heterodera schachtii TaxID=97005 RepID=A0ABD2JTK1_HETSC
MIYLLQLAIAFGLFSDSLLESNVVIASKKDKQIGKVIPPGRYKIAVWDKIKKKKPDYCDGVFIKKNNQSFLTEEALHDDSKECFDRFEHFITGEDGLIDPQNIVFYGTSFCDIKHTLNIHVFPMDPFNRLYKDEIDPDKYSPQQQIVQRIDAKTGKKGNKNRTDVNDHCDVHYHGTDKFKYLAYFFLRWQTGAKIDRIDLFMGKAYLNYFLWHDANEETWQIDEEKVLQMFSIELQKVAKKLNTRSQFAMTVLPELYEFCCPTDLANDDDSENCIGHEVANTMVKFIGHEVAISPSPNAITL